jgi:hypothetical protein
MAKAPSAAPKVARSAPGLPAATRAAFNRISYLGFAAIGATAVTAYVLGTKPTTDNSQQGISNTALIFAAVATVAVAYLVSRPRAV